VGLSAERRGIQTYAGIVVNNLLLPPGIMLFLAGLLR
jgi:hypothetical protein